MHIRTRLRVCYIGVRAPSTLETTIRPVIHDHVKSHEAFQGGLKTIVIVQCIHSISPIHGEAKVMVSAKISIQNTCVMFFAWRLAVGCHCCALFWCSWWLGKSQPPRGQRPRFVVEVSSRKWGVVVVLDGFGFGTVLPGPGPAVLCSLCLNPRSK